MDQVGRLQERVEIGVFRQEGRLAVEAFDEQSAHKRVLDQRVSRPIRGIEIAHDQELRRRIKADLDAIGVDRPAALRRDGCRHGCEIRAREPGVRFGNVRQAEAEIAPQPLLQGLIRGDVVVAEGEVERRPLAVADEINRQQDQGRLTQGVGFIVFVPAQEAEREKQNVNPALLLGGPGVAVDSVNASLQDFRRERRL
jgi:hypothetical protein